jgi:hypothetical protein
VLRNSDCHQDQREQEDSAEADQVGDKEKEPYGLT